MKPVIQRHRLGCGAACVAFLLNISYKKALKLFDDGEIKANSTGFFCKEIILALSKAGLKYKQGYIKPRSRNKIYRQGVIVFTKRSKRYPEGHYLCRTDGKWMNAWINIPDQNRKAAFEKRLPAKPTFIIYPI